MTSTPAPPPAFDSRTLGELVLGRLTEIEHLTAKEHRDQVGVWQDQADRERAVELSKNLGLYAQLADTAARSEHNDVLAAGQAATRRRTASDEF